MSGYNTVIFWINRTGALRFHRLGFRASATYARDYWRWAIHDCQGALSIDERRNSKLRFLRAVNTEEGGNYV